MHAKKLHAMEAFCKQPIRNTQHAADQARHEHCAYVELVFARDGQIEAILQPWTSIAAIFAVTHYVSLDPPSRARTNEEQSQNVVHPVG